MGKNTYLLFSCLIEMGIFSDFICCHLDFSLQQTSIHIQMKKINYKTTQWLVVFSLIFITLFSASCNKKSEDNPAPNPNDGNTPNITNNTVMHDAATGSLDKYMVSYAANDVNNGGDSYEVSAWNGELLGLADNYLRIFLNEIPAASKTYNWQTGGSSQGALTNDEFFIQVRINGKTWYGVYSTTAWTTSGSLQATIDGDKLIFAFSEIELSDNFISVNVTETKKISGKITIDKNAAVSDGTNNVTLDLLD